MKSLSNKIFKWLFKTLTYINANALCVWLLSVPYKSPLNGEMKECVVAVAIAVVVIVVAVVVIRMKTSSTNKNKLLLLNTLNKDNNGTIIE